MKIRTHAFTLVELLLALAITSLLVVLLANMVSATLGAWQQGRNRLDTFSTSREVLSRIGDEITAAVAQKDGIEFVENAAFSPAPSSPNAESIFFVAPYPSNGGGDLCVIAYSLDAATHELRRGFVSSDDAWDTSPQNRYKAAAYSSADLNWQPVAQGVLDFELRCYTQEDLDNDVEPSGAYNSQDSGIDGKTPRRVLIRIRVVDDKTLARASALPADVLARSAREFFADFSLPLR
ncbi:hypothetical protein BH18VER1_BH18VER1_17090 [soil metagenome]